MTLVLVLAGCGLLSSVEQAASPALPDVKPFADHASPPRIAPDAAAPPEDLTCRPGVASLDCFQRIPAATVTLGAQATDPAAPAYDPAAAPNEGPVRTVRVPAFWLQRHEVTVNAWNKCVAEGWCDPAQVGTGLQANVGRLDRLDHPVNQLTWLGARQVCASFGARLPTEAEWEYAARGTEGRRWPWGDTPGCGRIATAGETREWGVHMPEGGTCTFSGTTHPASTSGMSPFDLVAMAGNVWEWTADLYDAPDAGGDHLRTQRGGGWADEDPLQLRTTVRVGVREDLQLMDVGVRCAWSAP